MKENTIVVALGLGLAAVIGFAMMPKPRQKPVFRQNDVAEVVQGQMLTLRLPAGDYQMDGGGPLAVVAQNTVGIHTDIIIAVGSSASEYVVTPRFTNMSNPAQSFLLTVSAKEGA